MPIELMLSIVLIVILMIVVLFGALANLANQQTPPSKTQQLEAFLRQQGMDEFEVHFGPHYGHNSIMHFHVTYIDNMGGLQSCEVLQQADFWGNPTGNYFWKEDGLPKKIGVSRPKTQPAEKHVDALGNMYHL